MNQNQILPISNSNPPSSSPTSSEACTCWDSFIKDNQLTTFTIKEDQSLEFNLFEDSPIFNENPKGNLRKIKSRIKTILNTSSFPQDLVKAAKIAYKSDPQYMHLAIDRTDFREMRIFDVLDEEFESIGNLEAKGMLNKVEDEEFNWQTFGICKEINWINSHEKDLEEDEDYYKALSNKSKRGRKKQENPVRIKKEKQRSNTKENTEPTYWERCSKRRREDAYEETEIDQETDESFKAEEFEILIRAEEDNRFEEEQQQEKALKKKEAEVVLIELEEDESVPQEIEVVLIESEEGHSELEQREAILIESEEDLAKPEQEKSAILIELDEDELEEEQKRKPKARKRLQNKTTKELKRTDYGLVNGKRRREDSPEEFYSTELVFGIEKLVWPGKQQRKHGSRFLCLCEEDS